MNHCNQCGTKVSQDAKFCQNCGNGLKADSTKKPIDANLKVALTNETTEKVLKGVGSGVSSVLSSLKNIIKKLFIPVIVISIVGALITGIVVIMQQAQYELEREQSAAQVKKAMTFEVEKAMGIFQIKGMLINGRFLAYYQDGSYYEEQYSDSWPYNGGAFENRPTGKVTISNNQMTVHLDSNRDNSLSDDEKKTFMIKSISRSENPENFSYGVIDTNLDESIYFIINRPGSHTPYSLFYSIGDDEYILWLR